MGKLIEEGWMFNTALCQDIYTLESKYNGHYHHLDSLNRIRKAGSIRDDGPLHIVISDVYKAQDMMRSHVKKATTVICLATQLHSIATGNMTPS